VNIVIAKSETKKIVRKRWWPLPWFHANAYVYKTFFAIDNSYLWAFGRFRLWLPGWQSGFLAICPVKKRRKTETKLDKHLSGF